MNDLANIIRAERIAQGLPEVIEDIATLARIARIVENTDGRAEVHEKAAA